MMVNKNYAINMYSNQISNLGLDGMSMLTYIITHLHYTHLYLQEYVTMRLPPSLICLQ